MTDIAHCKPYFSAYFCNSSSDYSYSFLKILIVDKRLNLVNPNRHINSSHADPIIRKYLLSCMSQYDNRTSRVKQTGARGGLKFRNYSVYL